MASQQPAAAPGALAAVGVRGLGAGLRAAAPVPSHALMINEIAIVALFAMSLDLILGYTGIVSLGMPPSSASAPMPRRCSPST